MRPLQATPKVRFIQTISPNTVKRSQPSPRSPGFRSPLALKLAISFALSAVAATLIIRSGQALGSARFPVLLLGMCGSFTFLKLMLATAWTDPSALPLERRVCRGLIYTLALIFALLLASKLLDAAQT